MKLRVFKADKGDMLLLSSRSGKNHVMIDGGMEGSYRAHAAGIISKLKKLDVVYVSHIDRDHVEGIYEMLDDAVEWKVHDFLRTHGNPGHKAPGPPRPPRIGRFWQNNFHDQVGENAGKIQDMLASGAFVLSGHENADVRAMALEQQDLAQSVGDALRISWRIAEDQLDVPVNPEFDSGLIWVADPPDTFKVGTMRWTVIGPYREELEELRKEWNDWLKEKEKYKEDLKKRSTADFAPLLAGSVDAFTSPLSAGAEALAGSDERIQLALQEIGLAKVLGRRSAVTTPNLASLMFFVREGSRTILLTGDGHCDDILEGVDNAGLLRADGTLHVNVLKVPHHGSENNTSVPFTKAVTADKYVFCGNGEHGNPDLDVVKAYIDSRIGDDSRRSPGPEAGRPFRLVFNHHPDNLSGESRKHMLKVQGLVDSRAASSSKISSTFITRSSAIYTI